MVCAVGVLDEASLQYGRTLKDVLLDCKPKGRHASAKHLTMRSAEASNTAGTADMGCRTIQKNITAYTAVFLQRTLH